MCSSDLYQNLGYDPFRSFDHVSLLVTSPQVLAGATNFAPGSVPELVAFAKANPGKATYATVGAGSSNHLNALLLSNLTGIEMVHVPYKGGAPMMIDLVGGQVNVMFVSAPQAIPQLKAGRIKALADPEVRGKLDAQGFDVVGSTPGEFLAFARAESEKWAKVIRDYNIRVE